jgi:hypothetical protein
LELASALQDKDAGETLYDGVSIFFVFLHVKEYEPLLILDKIIELLSKNLKSKIIALSLPVSLTHCSSGYCLSISCRTESRYISILQPLSLGGPSNKYSFARVFDSDQLNILCM